ncbi:MAG TPA: hypothetical protein VFA45_03895 [Actinomycetes bacterium]|jgi:hypothetical protein|nr:hypothetical protein [Actinomycetes bacterium]
MANQPRDAELLPAVACTLGGEDLGAQAERWQRLGRVSGLSRAATEDGLRLSFRDEPAVEEELRALAAAESECCTWARWEVRREGGELVLHVTSSKDGIAALHTMFGAA